MVGLFVAAFEFLGVPFTIGYIAIGVSTVVRVRFLSSIVLAWLRVTLLMWYVQELRRRAFRNALDANTAYSDRDGSDDIRNAIVTQAEYARTVIRDVIRLLERVLQIAVYLVIAFYIATVLTIDAGLTIGALTVIVRHITESGYAVGAGSPRERTHPAARPGRHSGNPRGETARPDRRPLPGVPPHLDRFTEATIALARNGEIINNVYNLSVASSSSD